MSSINNRLSPQTTPRQHSRSSSDAGRPGSAGSAGSRGRARDVHEHRPVRRNLFPRFEALANALPPPAAPRPPDSPRLLPWDMDPPPVAASVSPARTQSVASEPFSEQSEWEAFDPDAEIDAHHNEVLALVHGRLAPVIGAMQPVIARIYAIEEAPARPSATGTCTPLWRDKVEMSDPNFIERVLPITLMRTWVHTVNHAETGVLHTLLQAYDALSWPEQQQIVQQTLHLESSFETLTDRLGKGALDDLMTRGLETGDWTSATIGDQERTAVRALSGDLIAWLDAMPRIIKNALVRAGIDRFNATLPS